MISAEALVIQHTPAISVPVGLWEFTSEEQLRAYMIAGSFRRTSSLVFCVARIDFYTGQGFWIHRVLRIREGRSESRAIFCGQITLSESRECLKCLSACGCLKRSFMATYTSHVPAALRRGHHAPSSNEGVARDCPYVLQLPEKFLLLSGPNYTSRVVNESLGPSSCPLHCTQAKFADDAVDSNDASAEPDLSMGR